MADAPEGPNHDIPGQSADETVDLVNRVRAGDQEALAVLMARFLPRLQRWASGRMPVALRNLADTSDLVQDVLLRSFPKVGQLDASSAVKADFRRTSVSRS